MLLSVFGTRGLTSRVSEEEFYCAVCDSHQAGDLKRVRKFFTVYYLPVIPLKVVGRYVECRRCGCTFPASILRFPPEAAREKFEAVYERTLRRLLVEMALADRFVTPKELERVRRIYRELTGETIGEDALAEELEKARADERDITDYLEHVAYQLNDSGKELALEAALAVARADGLLREEEKELVENLGEALEMTPDHVRGVLGSATPAG